MRIVRVAIAVKDDGHTDALLRVSKERKRRTTVRLHDVQSVEINVPLASAFEVIADPHRLPQWAEAFEEVNGDRAVLRTPAGSTNIRLQVLSSKVHGTIDWLMTFPDGMVASAYSRLTPLGEDHVVYSFVLTAPPLPLEQLEGALAQQSVTLERELTSLKALLELSRV